MLRYCDDNDDHIGCRVYHTPNDGNNNMYSLSLMTTLRMTTRLIVNITYDDDISDEITYDVSDDDGTTYDATLVTTTCMMTSLVVTPYIMTTLLTTSRMTTVLMTVSRMTQRR